MKPQHETHITINCDDGMVELSGVYTLGGEIVSEWTENGWEEVDETAVQNEKSNHFNWDWLKK